jgi:hypothetical protein
MSMRSISSGDTMPQRGAVLKLLLRKFDSSRPSAYTVVCALAIELFTRITRMALRSPM